MDIKLNDKENSRKEIEATLTYEELTPYFDKAIESYRKKATLPGFRKGKAPLNMIKKQFGEGIEYNALEDIAGEVFFKYITDNKLDVISKGAITDLDYKPKEKLDFKVEFDVMPEVKIEKFKGLSLKKKVNIIDKSLVEDEINYHKFRSATYEIDGVAADDDYMVTVNLQNLDEDGTILVGQSQNDLKVFLGNPEIYPEFKEGMSGIKEGEVRIIDSKNAEGGLKKVQITCTKVEKIIYPEMNEEFFKSVTGKEGLKDEKEFKEELKGELLKIYDGITERELKSEVVNEMIKVNDVPAPERYIDVILDSMVEDYKQQYKGKKIPADFIEEEFRKERRVDAILQSKWFLLRDKLIEDEKIEIDEESYKKLAETYAARFNMPVDKLVEAYKQNEDVKMRLLNDKVIDLIIENAEIEEIPELRTKEDTKAN
ncbi:MAG TPA: trigger factor [Ignavibacteria bacterium]|nr:trigger factor [Ignavibacteria bacterium]HRB01002.1 trigger factor [Ignavibacteria bacterium]